MSLFDTLEDEESFVNFVKSSYMGVPAEISAVMACKPSLDDDRLKYAHKEYMQCLSNYALYLHSSNPDHYKRAGALLFALHQAKPIVELGLESSSEDLSSGFTRVTNGDGASILQFVEFWEEFHQETLAFNLAYICCSAFEDDPVVYDLDYLRNVCFYLHNNKNLTVDSLFMLFKSLMLKS